MFLWIFPVSNLNVSWSDFNMEKSVTHMTYGLPVVNPKVTHNIVTYHFDYSGPLTISVKLAVHVLFI